MQPIVPGTRSSNASNGGKEQELRLVTTGTRASINLQVNNELRRQTQQDFQRQKVEMRQGIEAEVRRNLRAEILKDIREELKEEGKREMIEKEKNKVRNTSSRADSAFIYYFDET